MPNRIIKESICESKGLSDVSFFAADLYKRLVTYADDYGRFNADFQIILARLYPREIGLVNVDDIEEAMTDLAGVGKIAFYTSAARDELYGCFPKWNEHQRIRNSKRKLPDPDDVSINDWYLRRYVPLTMKIEIVQRDKFTCQECGRLIFPADEMDAKRFVKMGAGLFHIDHIVPVNQGGRATKENLRLLCPKCDLSRKKRFTFEEIAAMSQKEPAASGNSPQLAATRRNFRPNPIQSNPIRIQSESESNPEKNDDDGFEEFWNCYPRKSGDIREAYFEYLGALQNGATLESLKEAVEWQTKAKGVQYMPSAETWLRNKGWTEAKPDPSQEGEQHSGKRKKLTDEEARADAEEAAKTFTRNFDDIYERITGKRWEGHESSM